jgi:acyl dehydratase
MMLHTPVYPGDTICVESEIVAKRESRSRPEAGIITWVHRAFNQEGRLVVEIRRTNLVYKREYSPWRKLLAIMGMRQ